MTWNQADTIVICCKNRRYQDCYETIQVYCFKTKLNGFQYYTRIVLWFIYMSIFYNSSQLCPATQLVFWLYAQVSAPLKQISILFWLLELTVRVVSYQHSIRYHYLKQTGEQTDCVISILARLPNPSLAYLKLTKLIIILFNYLKFIKARMLNIVSYFTEIRIITYRNYYYSSI
jgi:hypothetical protein